MDAIYHNCNLSKIYYDCFITFSEGYRNAAELIVTTIFAKYGIYDFVKLIASEDDIIKYTDMRICVQASYVWSELYEVSDMLRCSYLYTHIHKSTLYSNLFNDDILNNITKQFKTDLIVYLQQHSKFFAYCDLESCGLFLYTNPEQALDKDKFVLLYSDASNAINDIYRKYQGKIPKILLSCIQQIRTVIDVREMFGEHLVIQPPKDILLKCLPTFDKKKITDIVFDFQKCSLKDLHLHLETLYSNLCLLHVISSIDWVVLMQGRLTCHSCFKPIQEFVSIERLEYLKLVQDTIVSPDTPFMKQELVQLTFLRKALKLLKNSTLLQNYSLTSIGYNNQFVIGNATRLYLNNINLIIYADLLFIGMYGVIENKWLPSHEQIHEIIVSAEKDLKIYQDLVESDLEKYPMFLPVNLSIRTTHTFKQSLKKMKRFYRWLKRLQYDDLKEQEEIQEGIDLIFGDVVDNDGQPTICPICLDSSYERKETWWKLQPCCHMIHLDCYNKLFETEHFHCPMCRKKIT